MRMWALAWASLADSIVKVLTLGMYDPMLELRLQGWFLDREFRGKPMPDKFVK
jgi:uncharacterized membrane protein YjgN (DUF898 family)